MPGVFGVLAKKETAAGTRLQAMAQRMALALRRLPWLKVDLQLGHEFCGGRIFLDTAPAASSVSIPTGMRWMWLDGEVFRRDTLHANGNSGLAAAPWDEAVLRQLDGVFALARYDPDTRQLTLASDRLGFRPVYTLETPDWFAYAPEVKALLSIVEKLPPLDDTALRQFFAFDYLLGTRTWWRGITLLPPATILRVNASGARAATYWSFGDIKHTPAAEEDVARQFAELWGRAVRDRTRPGRTPFLLSGGLDSRFLLAEMRQQGADLLAISFGDQDSTDVRIAAQVAQAGKLPHRILPINRGTWWHGREEAIWQTDGQANAIHLHSVIARDDLHSGNSCSLNCMYGDLLFGGSQLEDIDPGDWPSSPGKLLSSQFQENPFFSVDEVVERSLPDVGDSLQGPSFDCFQLRQRVRRGTLCGNISLATHCELSLPTTALPLIELFLGSLTDDQRRHSRFYSAFLASRYPTYFRNIPWQDTGRGLRETIPARAARKARTLTRRVYGRLSGRRHRVGVAYAHYSQYVASARIAEQLLAEPLIADEILSGKVRQLLLEKNPPFADARVVLCILTLETYLRQTALHAAGQGIPADGGVERGVPTQA
jgi:hypothetical protein